MADNAGNSKSLVIFGAGGHGLVIAEAASVAGWRVLGFCDDRHQIGGVGAWTMVDEHKLEDPSVGVIVAIGDNTARRRVSERLHDRGCRLVSVVHPTAWISPSASIEPGVYVGPGALVTAQAQVATGVIVNSGAIVEHHCRIDAYVHLAPRVALGARVHIGTMSLVGVGASVRPDVRIGQGATVGIGAAVVRNVDDRATVVGVPARPLR